MRVYGGVEGDLRRDERRTQLLEAGLDVLGAAEETPLTVRGVCQRAGLATRYFYESFADRDALAEAVFDTVITDLAQTALTAVTDAPPQAQAKVRAGLAAIVGIVANDPRRGRLLFATSLSSRLLAQRRLRSAQLFASLLTAEAREFYGLDADSRLAVVAQFLVGGLAQTLTAWLAGDLPVDQPEIVDHCAGVFLAVAARQIT